MALSAIAQPLFAQEATTEPANETTQKPEMAAWANQCDDWDLWDKPALPFRIHGNSYYVGTCGISVILIAGEAGHILIDSGTMAGAQVVLANIRALGFDPQDVEMLLYSHEHWDHVGGMSLLSEATGAPLTASLSSYQVMASGRADQADPQHADLDEMTPVEVRYAFEGPTTIGIGALRIDAIPTPGHTIGATSWSWQSCDSEDVCRTIVYGDGLSATSAETYRYTDNDEYVVQFRQGLAALAALEKCDIFLSPHPSFADMRTKLLTGDLTSGKTCADHAAEMSQRLDNRLTQEGE